MLENIIDGRVIACEPDTPIKRVAQMMEKENVGAVIVTADGKPIGIVTDRDIVLRCVSQSMDCDGRAVKAIMSAPVDTVNKNAGVYDVIHMMKKNEIRRIPVVDDKGKAVGLVSFGDMYQLLGREISDLAASASPKNPKVSQKTAA